ncbi:60S ribosomal protein L38 [Mycoemilia scoparia]|uniref:Large ribosomal subunit protein eL38 n=1 Tax=Mycoemilia scoparia TaxID=417184 RepID=A0A9W8A3S9_9FUNG|nr:60S ribosomal protein L38 [Mycoemilia scoparia]
MAKEVKDIKNFLEITRRRDVRSIRIKKNGNITKFKVRGSRFLYTLSVNDGGKAKKLREAFPPGLEVKTI